jgi:outer membrane protein TolC
MRLQSFQFYIILSAIIAVSPLAGLAQQPRSFSLQEAVLQATQNNRTLKANALDISIAGEQVRVAKSLSLPAVQLGAQYLHYFSLPAFFGLGDNGGNSKIPFSRIGGRDQFSGTLSASYPI